MQSCLDSKQRIVDFVGDRSSHPPENCLSFGCIQRPLRFDESRNILDRSTQVDNLPFPALYGVNNSIEMSQGAERGVAAKLLGDRLARLDSPRECFLDEATVIDMQHL